MHTSSLKLCFYIVVFNWFFEILVTAPTMRLWRFVVSENPLQMRSLLNRGEARRWISKQSLINRTNRIYN